MKEKQQQKQGRERKKQRPKVHKKLEESCFKSRNSRDAQKGPARVK